MYNNVVCHTSDILLELARRHIPEGIPDRELMNDAFFIGREATQNVMATATANHQSHVTFERLLLLNRDTRPQMKNLGERLLAQARVFPSDSDDYIFGTQHTKLEQDMKDLIDRQPHPYVAPSTSSASGQQPFRSASATGRGSGNYDSKKAQRGGKSSGKKSQGKENYSQKDTYHKRDDYSDSRRGDRGKGDRGKRGGRK